MTIIEGEHNYNLNENFARRKYFRKKHALLIFIRDQNDLGNHTTISHIVSGFGISRAFAWKLLERLEKEKDVEKGVQIIIGNEKYHNYFVTHKARQELRVLAKTTIGKRINGH